MAAVRLRIRICRVSVGKQNMGLVLEHVFMGRGAIAFLVSLIGLAFAFFLISIARYIWRNGRFWNAKTSLGTPPTIALIDHEHTYLSLAPPNRELWKANVRLSRSCEKLQIRLDYSSFSGGVGRGIGDVETNYF